MVLRTPITELSAVLSAHVKWGCWLSWICSSCLSPAPSDDSRPISQEFSPKCRTPTLLQGFPLRMQLMPTAFLADFMKDTKVRALGMLLIQLGFPELFIIFRGKEILWPVQMLWWLSANLFTHDQMGYFKQGGESVFFKYTRSSSSVSGVQN